MKILGFVRKPRWYRRYLFDDLPPEVRWRAEGWLAEFCRRWRGNLPSWRLAILIGQARRLAVNPPTSQWGRSMLAKRGGYAVQRLYRLEGRNPTARATQMSRYFRKAHKRAREQAEERARRGLPAPSRHGFTNLDGI